MRAHTSALGSITGIAVMGTIFFGILAPEALARNQIRIVGSSTVFPFSSMVAEQFGNRTQFPTPVVESLGTGGGLKLFCQGIGPQHVDIANASRRIKDSERLLCASNGVAEITEVAIGFDGIVLAHSKHASSMTLTLSELWLALAERVPINGSLAPNPYTRWSEINATLPDVMIEVYGPPPTSGTRDAFVELAMAAGCSHFAEVTAMPDAEDRMRVCHSMRQDGRHFIEAGENDNLIIQKVRANPDALGIFGFSFLDQNTDTLQGTAIEGVAPTFENIATGDYPLSRSLYFYVKSAHAAFMPSLIEFVTEFTSESAFGYDGYLSDKGLIPLPEEERVRVRTRARSLTPMR